MAKHENPYNRLRRKAREMAEKVVNPRTRDVINYTGAKSRDDLARNLFWMAMAADSAGCDLVLVADFTNDRVRVQTVKRHGITYVPHEFQG